MVVGWHATEGIEDILRRKADDIAKAGQTIWMYQSWKATVPMVQTFGGANIPPNVYFLKGSARPTSSSHQANQISSDGSHWSALPSGMGGVTGKLPGGGLVLDKLTELEDQEIDLWEYIEHSTQSPLKFQLGASTACVVPSPAGAVGGMKSRIRQVVAVGQLAAPYAVYLR